MVKLYAISIFFRASDEAKVLKSHYDLQSFSFFQRGSVQEFIQFASKTITERTSPCTRQSVKQDVYMCHVYVRSDNLAAVLIADHEYPGNLFFSITDNTIWILIILLFCTGRVAHTLLTKIMDDFSANPLTKMQNDLDETKIILRNTIEQVLIRGEKLDDLVSQSEELSAQSKAFYKTAKKTNSCCNFS